MLRFLQRLRRDEEGQSLVLACVAMLILAFGVMTTINLGRAIHQRIGLQNTADTEAYSMAALEARSFNFYAFTNRTQIVHYVSAMTVQTYISVMSAVIAMFEDFVAILKTLSFCNDASNICADIICALLDIIGIGEILATLSEIADMLSEIVAAIEAVLDAIDAVLAQVIHLGLQNLNRLMYLFDKLMSEVIFATDLPNGYDDVVLKNDDQLTGSSAQKLAMGAASAAIYNQAYDPQSGGQPLGGIGNMDGTFRSGDTDPNPAKRTMTEMVNASRRDSDSPFLTDRELGRGFGLSHPAALGTILNLLGVHKLGQTKLTSRPIMSYRKNDIHTTGFDGSQLSQGNTLAADDLYYLGWDLGPFALGWSNEESGYKNQDSIADWDHHQSGFAARKYFHVSVWADTNGGAHWKLDASRPLRKKTIGLDLGFFSCGITYYWANVHKANENYHYWDGITPFMSFNITGTHPGGFRGEELFYGQPSTYAYLNKTYDQTKHDSAGDSTDRLKATEMNNLTVATPTAPVTMNTTNQAAAMPGMRQGYNVLSRGLAYYHRPHNWEEMPNFFNPYWRAKLDPLWLGIKPIEHAVPGGNIIGGLINVIPNNLAEQVVVH